MFKLLSPKAIKDAKTNDFERAKEMENYMTEKTLELNEFKRKTEEQKRSILEDFVTFARKIAHQKQELQRENDTKEEKRQKSFDSLARLSLGAENNYRLAQEIEDKTNQREDKLNDREERLNNRENKLDGRENMLSDRASNLSVRDSKLKDAENDLEDRKISVDLDITRREKKIEHHEERIEERLGELSLAAQANEKTAELLKDKESKFKKEMADEYRLLKDRRETLDRGFEELRLKQNHG